MNIQNNKIWISIIFVVDMILTAVGFILGGIMSGVPVDFSGGSGKYIVLFDVLLVFFFAMYDLYKTKSDEVFNACVSTTFSSLFAGISTFLIAFALKWKMFSIFVWIIELITIWILLLVWRTIVALLIKRYGPKKKCMIIENMNNNSRLARKLKYSTSAGRESTYFMVDEENEEEIEILLNEKMADFDLVFISPAISSDITQRIMCRAFILGKEVGVLADLDSISTFHGTIYQVDDTPVLEKKCANMSRFQRFVKRAIDIVFSLVLCTLCIPIFIACAVLIKLDSKGPVFYKQERYTRHKKVFNVYKFRTMVADAEKEGAQLATENDPRITKIGRFLRATRLDELPQLFNILSGSMSVVGPRPERPVFADEFSKMVRDYDMRYLVKAGLTGYAQIYGKYNTRVSDKILMDMIYIINYSLLLDVKIILLTGKTMFVKSATEGVDEEKDKELLAEENEEKRREETVKNIIGGIKDDSNSHHTRV